MERRDRGRNTEGVDWTGLLDVDEFRGGVRKGEGGLAKGPRQTMEGFMGVVWEESRSQDKVILDDEILNRVRGLVNAGNAEQKFMGLYGMCLALRPKLGVSEEIKAWMESNGGVYRETAEKVLGFVWEELKSFEWPKEMSPGLQKFYQDQAEEQVQVFATDKAWIKRQKGETKIRKKGKEIPKMQPWESNFYYTLKEFMISGLRLGEESKVMRGVWLEIAEAVLLFKTTVEEEGSVVKSMKARYDLRKRLWGGNKEKLARGYWGCEAVGSMLRSEIKDEDDKLLLLKSLGEEVCEPLNVPLLKIVRK